MSGAYVQFRPRFILGLVFTRPTERPTKGRQALESPLCIHPHGTHREVALRRRRRTSPKDTNWQIDVRVGQYSLEGALIRVFYFKKGHLKSH
jgi:hypothetical protein